MEAKVDPTSGLASIIQNCFPSTLFGGDPCTLITFKGVHSGIKTELGKRYQSLYFPDLDLSL